MAKKNKQTKSKWRALEQRIADAKKRIAIADRMIVECQERKARLTEYVVKLQGKPEQAPVECVEEQVSADPNNPTVVSDR